MGAAALCLTLIGLPAPSAAVASTQAGDSTVTIGVLALPRTLDPLLEPPSSAADITACIFGSLLAATTRNALAPDLAASYSISPDGLRYTFSLDPRARWQDGEPVTAADVLFTAKLMRDTAFPAYDRYGFGNIVALSASGPLTVTATLRVPYAPFLRAFATTPLLPSHVLAPLPVGAIAGYAAFNRRPLGSGPYQVTEQGADQITLTAVPGFFRGTPRVARLVFRRLPSRASALAALRDGSVQVLGASVGVTPRQALDALATGTLGAYVSPGFGWTHIDLIQSGFLRDHLVRQALAYATPRQRIVATLFDGLASQADADQPPTSQYYEPAVAGSYPYDTKKAAALLKARKYTFSKGRWIKFGRVLAITLWLDRDCATCGALAEEVRRSWAAAGIPTTLRTLPTRQLFGPTGPLANPARLASADLNAVLYTWAASPEPDDSYYWSSSMIVRPGHTDGGNFVGYRNPRTDALLARALTTTEESRRIALYRAIQRLLVEDQPVLFLCWTPHLSLATNALHGYEANPFHAGVSWDAGRWSLEH